MLLKYSYLFLAAFICCLVLFCTDYLASISRLAQFRAQYGLFLSVPFLEPSFPYFATPALPVTDDNHDWNQVFSENSPFYDKLDTADGVTAANISKDYLPESLRIALRRLSDVNHSCAEVMHGFETRHGRLGNRLFFAASILGIGTANVKPPVLKADTLASLAELFPLVTRLLRGRKAKTKYSKTLVLRRTGQWYPETLRLSCRQPVYVFGYTQSWRFFEHIQAELRSLFTFFNPRVAAECRHRWRKLRGLAGDAALVGIHVRRGDFGRNEENGYVQVSPAYVQSAIAWYQRNLGQKTRLHFVAVGEDPAWNWRHLKPYNVTVLVTRTPESDLCLLARCDHTIISTGSFSWWVGFLAGGRVVRPKLYARGSVAEGLEEKDHFPPDWIPI